VPSFSSSFLVLFSVNTKQLPGSTTQLQDSYSQFAECDSKQKKFTSRRWILLYFADFGEGRNADDERRVKGDQQALGDRRHVGDLVVAAAETHAKLN